MARNIILAASFLAALCAPLSLQASAAEVERETEVLTVVGTRTERQLNEVGATISVITSEEIERQISRDISDLVRFEAGVSVSGTGSRFGLSGFNIRGIEGNRVLTVVDGVRVPDEFSFGPFLSSRRDFVDVDSVEMVEIARGPISSLYGSDALGGIVSFTTKTPSYYVSDDEPFHAGVNLGYSSDDSSANGATTLAAGNDTIAGLITYTRREADETETQGSSGFLTAARQEADPQDIEVDSFSAKLELEPRTGHTLLLGYEQFEHTSDAQILSDYGLVLAGFGPPTIVNTRDASDTRERQKWTFDYNYDGDNGWSLGFKVYQQTGTTEQRTDENRTAASGPQTRFRYSEFEQEIEGALLQVGTTFATGEVNHTLTYGVDYYVTDNESLRNGGTFLLDGTPVFEFNPLPTRDFPITEVTQIAYFLQDEIEFLDGKLRVTPGLRYDQFDAETEVDAIYLSGNPGTAPPEDYDDSELTASLSVVYQLNEAWSVFGRYSEGFRAPPYDDVNVGFTNPLGNYKTISNTGLVSETSQGYEVGLRWDSQFGNMLLSAFTNDYEDFIDPLSIAPQFLATGGIDPVDGFRTFQSVNRAEVEIDGIELSGLLELGELTEVLQGFGLRYSLAYADGEDVQADEPLDTVNPFTAVLGLIYDAPNGRWGGQLLMTLVEGKDASDISSDSDRPETSGYGIIDLLTYVDLTEKISLNVGLFNITDREYIRWGDTLSIGTDAPERFTQPGFNAGATLKVVF
ncbi:MAG: TonB-dependent hemoglobin/transferrin/lactoferrin family receptor [Pseudomonadota bacterium]